MSPIAEFDQRLEQMIREFALRILVPRWTEFDAVWEAAIRVCDRYELGKDRREKFLAEQSKAFASEPVISSAEPSATHEPAQTLPLIAA